jgi:hypothetical protein
VTGEKVIEDDGDLLIRDPFHHRRVPIAESLAHGDNLMMFGMIQQAADTAGSALNRQKNHFTVVKLKN